MDDDRLYVIQWVPAPLAPNLILPQLHIMLTVAPDEFKSGGNMLGAKRQKNIFVAPLHFLALQLQLVVLVSTFVMVSTVWSVSCLLFFYLRCMPYPTICKSGEWHMPPSFSCPMSRHYWCVVGFFRSIADLLPSAIPECRFPSEYHGEWYHFDSDRSEKVTLTSEHISFAILGEFVCKSKHWSINYYKLFSVYANGWSEPPFICSPINTAVSVVRGSFRKGTRGNAVPIVKVCKNARALWTALRSIFRQKCTTLQDFAYTISKIFRGIRRTLAEAPLVPGPIHQFPLGSPAFPLFLFYETTTGIERNCVQCILLYTVDDNI